MLAWRCHGPLQVERMDDSCCPRLRPWQRRPAPSRCGSTALETKLTTCKPRAWPRGRSSAGCILRANMEARSFIMRCIAGLTTHLQQNGRCRHRESGRRCCSHAPVIGAALQAAAVVVPSPIQRVRAAANLRIQVFRNSACHCRSSPTLVNGK